MPLHPKVVRPDDLSEETVVRKTGGQWSRAGSTPEEPRETVVSQMFCMWDTLPCHNFPLYFRAYFPVCSRFYSVSIAGIGYSTVRQCRGYWSSGFHPISPDGYEGHPRSTEWIHCPACGRYIDSYMCFRPYIAWPWIHHKRCLCVPLFILWEIRTSALFCIA